MNRRKLLIILALTFLACLVLGLLFSNAGPLALDTTITVANGGRIKAGQTRAEVEKLLGPPRYEPGGTKKVGIMVAVQGGHKLEHWCSPEASILICFDENGKVVWVSAGPLDPVPQWRACWRQVTATLGIQ
jgi:hypothetical protein